MLITMASVILVLFFLFHTFFDSLIERDITLLSDLQTPEVIKKYPTVNHIFKCVFGNEVIHGLLYLTKKTENINSEEFKWKNTPQHKINPGKQNKLLFPGASHKSGSKQNDEL